jgi:hypothetical protein
LRFKANAWQLNYLLKRPPFLATCVFGVVFILVGNASANAMSFAIHVLAAAGYSGSLQNPVRGIAVATVTIVCLLHGMWRRLGIVVNNTFAFIKILMMIMIIIVGFTAIGGKVYGGESPAGANFDPHSSFSGAQNQPYGYAEAYLGVVFTFGGFNQANYVRRARFMCDSQMLMCARYWARFDNLEEFLNRRHYSRLEQFGYCKHPCIFSCHSAYYCTVREIPGSSLVTC